MFLNRLSRALMGTVLVAALGAASASAQSLVAPSGLTVDADSLFLRLHNSHGTLRSNVFDFEPGQRLALTYMGDNGVGARTTWFQWDHSRIDAGGIGLISLDTYNLDFEIFKRLNLTERSILEMSGGVRYNETEHLLGAGNFNDYTGFGGLLGVRGGVRVFDNGLLYAGGKFSVLMGDGAHDGNAGPLNPANEVARSQTEIALGYEHRFDVGRVTIIPRTGLEWQMWDGFSIDRVDEHPDTDLGFSGFVAGLGVNF